MFISPAKAAGASTVQVTVNTKQSGTKTFAYDSSLALTVTNLNIHSASPIKKCKNFSF